MTFDIETIPHEVELIDQAEMLAALNKLRVNPTEFLKFAGCYTVGDFVTFAGDRRFVIVEALPRTVPHIAAPPREKPSHKLTTFERMRQSEAARRSRIKRLLK